MWLRETNTLETYTEIALNIIQCRDLNNFAIRNKLLDACTIHITFFTIPLQTCYTTVSSFIFKFQYIKLLLQNLSSDAASYLL